MIPLTLSGPPRQRGRVHGEALRERIAAAIEAWFGHLSERTEPEDFVADLYHRSGLRTGVGRHAPGLLQEVEGIAEASSQPIETMLAWQFVDESWWYLDERTRAPQPHERCSALAVNHAGTGIVAQTMDLHWHFDGTQIMLRYLDDSGLEILAPSTKRWRCWAGLPAPAATATRSAPATVQRSRRCPRTGWASSMTETAPCTPITR